MQSAFVMGSAVLLMINGVARIINPVMIEKTNVGIAVTVFTIFMTLALVVVQNGSLQKRSR